MIEVRLGYNDRISDQYYLKAVIQEHEIEERANDYEIYDSFSEWIDTIHQEEEEVN